MITLCMSPSPFNLYFTPSAWLTHPGKVNSLGVLTRPSPVATTGKLSAAPVKTSPQSHITLSNWTSEKEKKPQIKQHLNIHDCLRGTWQWWQLACDYSVSSSRPTLYLCLSRSPSLCEPCQCLAILFIPISQVLGDALFTCCCICWTLADTI